MSDHTLELADGRKLSWAEYGDPAGRPLVALHGTPGSRRQWAVSDGPAREAGVRVIAPERPGCGLSSPFPQLTFSAYADDLRQLLDALALPQVVLAGASGGGGFALEAAAVLGQRLSLLLLICAMVPSPPAETLVTRSRHVGTAFSLAKRLPWIAAPALARMSRGGADPGPSLERKIRSLPEADKRVARMMAADPAGSADAVEAVRQGGRAAVRELSLYAQPFTTDLSRITAPVTILHGEQDANVPLAVARWLAAQLPQAELVQVPDAAHLFLVERPDLVLARVANPASPSGGSSTT